MAPAYDAGASLMQARSSLPLSTDYLSAPESIGWERECSRAGMGSLGIWTLLHVTFLCLCGLLRSGYSSIMEVIDLMMECCCT